MVWVLVDIAGHHYWTNDGSFLPMDMEPLPPAAIAAFPDLGSAEEEVSRGNLPLTFICERSGSQVR